MSFTDRFITLPIRIVDNKESDLMGKEAESIPTYEKVLPMDISCYYPSVDTKVSDGEFTQVYMKSGHTFMAYCTIAEFEKVLNEFGNK